jgi:hypothetical protein
VAACSEETSRSWYARCARLTLVWESVWASGWASRSLSASCRMPICAYALPCAGPPAPVDPEGHVAAVAAEAAAMENAPAATMAMALERLH